MTVAARAAEGWWPRTARTLESLTAGRRYAVAFALGAIAAAAQAPVNAIPVLVVSFTGLVWLIDASRTRRAAFFAGWWFAFGYFVAGLYWIAFAMLTDPARFGWMIPFAVGGLSAYLAIYAGLATLAVHATPVRGAGRVLVLAVAWTAAEWVRGHALTGFPWNLVGNVWTAVPPVMQLAAFVGSYGLGLLTVAAAASPAVLADRRPRGWIPAAVAVLLVGAAWVGGALRIPAGPAPTVPGVALRVVQPDIAQEIKRRDDRRAAILAKLLALSTAPAPDGSVPTHIIWPETAAPFFVASDPVGRRILARALEDGQYLITGTLRISPRGAPFQVWNSVVAVDGAGAVRATYDKFHLVPFGEFVPFRSVLPIAKLTPGGVDFSRGPGPRTIALPGAPAFSPLICYEVIFPGAVAGEPRPGWLLNVTNDGWFGVSSGPYQHFASARMRAVEEGLPLVRAANTGISAVVDPYGRVVAQLGLAREGAIDSPLPEALAQPTLYARFGDWPVVALAVLALALAAVGRRPRGGRSRPGGGKLA